MEGQPISVEALERPVEENRPPPNPVEGAGTGPMKESDGEPRVLKTTSLERDLGVLVSDNLKATSHCQAVAKKGSRALRLLKWLSAT